MDKFAVFEKMLKKCFNKYIVIIKDIYNHYLDQHLDNIMKCDIIENEYDVTDNMFYINDYVNDFLSRLNDKKMRILSYNKFMKKYFYIFKEMYEKLLEMYKDLYMHDDVFIILSKYFTYNIDHLNELIIKCMGGFMFLYHDETMFLHRFFNKTQQNYRYFFRIRKALFLRVNAAV